MKPGQFFVDLCGESVVKESLTAQTGSEGETPGDAPADHFRGVTKLIVYVKQWASDHFRGATKMVVYGKVRPAAYVVGIRQFSTQCEENLNKVLA